MKRVVFRSILLIFSASLSWAGTRDYAATDTKETAACCPTCDWYRVGEWQISLWGAYGFPENQNGHDLLAVAAAHELNEGFDNNEGNIGRINNDRFLNDDDVGGGGVDLKYFFTHNMGVGLEGFALAANTRVGGGLATFTFRYPIGCTALAPYLFGGIGATFGGSESVAAEDRFDRELFFRRDLDQTGAILAGAAGAGLELRVTKRIGIMADFTWYLLDKPDNNFGLIRSGINFAF